MAKFEVQYTVTGVVELDPEILQRVQEEDWKKTFYNLGVPDDVVDMIFQNLLKGCTIPQLDGFADLPEDAADISNVDFQLDSVETLED